MKKVDLNRRDFVTTTAMAFGGFALLPMSRARAITRARSVSDKIVLGLIGCKGMGSSDARSCLSHDNVELAALCDVDQNVLAERAAEFETLTGKKPELFSDYRKLLERDDIDAVIIATPDHWHAIQMIDACAAGKHVYVEKPMAHSIEESQRMVAAADYYDRVVQVGQWQRSGPHWQDAIDYLNTGEIGSVRTVKTWAYMDWEPIRDMPDSSAPTGVDYDTWLGPRPKRPFNENRFHWNFRWFWDYAGGLMTDWGVHLIDVVLWAMEVEAPLSAISGGGHTLGHDSGMETPDTLVASYDFGGFLMTWEHAVGIALGPYQRGHGVAFVGNNGTLVMDRRGWSVIPETEERSDGSRGYKLETFPDRSAGRDQGGLLQHTENFLTCIREGGTPAASVQVGHRAVVSSQLGNLAYRTGSRVVWDRKHSRVEDNAAANQLLALDYRAPWSLPRVG